MSERGIQRTLGKIEATQAAILAQLITMRTDFNLHGDADAKQFAEMVVKYEAMKADQDKAKGAGWVILGLLGAFAAFVGSAVIAVLGGWVQFRA
jgi:hypothetical protein